MDHFDKTLGEKLGYDVSPPEGVETMFAEGMTSDEMFERILGEDSGIVIPDRQMGSTNTEITTGQETQKYLPAAAPAPELEKPELTDEQDKTDQELARAALRTTLETITKDFHSILTIAKASEHPRAFEVAATFARTIVDAAEKLDGMVEKKKSKQPSNQAGNAETTVNGNVYNQQYVIASTEDMMSQIIDARNAERKAAQEKVIDVTE
jgi:hypothetical protein